MPLSYILGLIALVAGTALACTLIAAAVSESAQFYLRDNPPTKPGWYWLEDGQGPGLSPRAVEVGPVTKDGVYIVEDPMVPESIIRTLDDYEHAQWAGPIPKPVDEPEWMKYPVF